MLQTLLDLLLDPKTIASAIAAILGSGFIAKLIFSAIRRRNVAWGVHDVFYIFKHLADGVNDGSKLDQGLDLAKVFLQKLDEYMVANGWRPLEPGEQPAAVLKFQSLSGQHLAKAELASPQ